MCTFVAHCPICWSQFYNKRTVIVFVIVIVIVICFVIVIVVHLV